MTQEEYNEAVRDCEEEIKDANSALEQSKDELHKACEWYDRCYAKLNMERWNLQALRNKEQ